MYCKVMISNGHYVRCAYLGMADECAHFVEANPLDEHLYYLPVRSVIDPTFLPADPIRRSR